MTRGKVLRFKKLSDTGIGVRTGTSEFVSGGDERVAVPGGDECAVVVALRALKELLVLVT